MLWQILWQSQNGRRYDDRNCTPIFFVDTLQKVYKTSYIIFLTFLLSSNTSFVSKFNSVVVQ